MNNTVSSKSAFLHYALVVIATAFLFMLFGRGFLDPDEGRYGEIPREMVSSGDWLEMRMLDYRYYEKPPMAYWITAPAIAVFGNRDWAARIPLFINMLCIAALFYRMLRRQWPDQARTSMLLCLISVGFTAGFTILMTDPFLALFFAMTCYWAREWFRVEPNDLGRKRRLALAAGCAAAAGFLTKGAVAVVLPGAIILIWMFWSGFRRKFRLALPLQAGGVFLILTGAALLVIERHNPGFLRQFIWEEHIARFTGIREIQVHVEPPWFFAKTLLLFLLPWTLFVFRAIRMIIIRHALQKDDLSKFLLVWSAVVVLFFSVSIGKLMSYILPAILPILILVVRWGVIEPADGSPADRRLISLGIAGTFITMTALMLGWLISYFQLLPDDLHAVRGISIAAFIPMALGLTALPRLRPSRDYLPALAFINSCILLTATLMLSPLAGSDFNYTAHLNSSPVYQALAKQLTPDDKIVSLCSYRPSLSFYTDRVYRPFQSRNELTYGMRMEPDRPADLQSAHELRDLIASTVPAKVYALIEPKHYPALLAELGIKYRETDLPRNPATVIIELLQ